MISNWVKTKISNSSKTRSSTLAAHLLIYLVVRVQKRLSLRGLKVMEYLLWAIGTQVLIPAGDLDSFRDSILFHFSLSRFHIISFLKLSISNILILPLKIFYRTVICNHFMDERLLQVSIWRQRKMLSIGPQMLKAYNEKIHWRLS